MTTHPPPTATRLAQLIGGHTAKLALQTQQITTLRSRAASLQTASASNTSAIGANTASITTNSSDITTNTSDITTLQGQMPANYAFLATLASGGSPTKIGGNSTPAAGSPGTTYSQAYLSAFASDFNDLLDYTNSMATALNSLYDALQSAGIIS